MSSESKCERVVYLMQRTDKIYDGTDIYVGSTSLSLKLRLSNHRSKAKVCDTRLYTRMREVGAKNWGITVLETNPLCDKKEIFILEKKWIEKLKPDLNVNFPVRENNEGSRKSARRHRLRSLEGKRYYCNVCDKIFAGNYYLQIHFNSLKHQRTYLNSVD